MTEGEWLACTDPTPMLECLEAQDLLTDRKQRLFDYASVRRIWHLLLDERGRRAVDVAERYADGIATLDELREAQGIALAAADAQATLSLPGTPNSYSVLAAAAGTAWEFRSGADPLQHAAEAIAWEGLAVNRPPKRRLAKAKFTDERKIQAALLRDIFGKPFRPVYVDSPWLAWHASTLLNLAEGIYNNRVFDRLPILADALQEAGCTNSSILAHCWLPGPHVRGCWVVDLILGKE